MPESTKILDQITQSLMSELLSVGYDIEFVPYMQIHTYSMEDHHYGTIVVLGLKYDTTIKMKGTEVVVQGTLHPDEIKIMFRLRYDELGYPQRIFDHLLTNHIRQPKLYG